MKKRLREKAWRDFLNGRKTPLTKKLGLDKFTLASVHVSLDLESGISTYEWMMKSLTM